jgi:phosphoribosyl 1,2-cyclic phosphate phosphodiesterase
MMEIEILGSGTSMGVPMVGCDCRVCTSEDKRNHRTRTSALIRVDGVHILIDTSIDYRYQMLRAGAKKLDAVIYTHYHVDHILGMDDLRSLNILNKQNIPIFASPDTLRNIKRVFKYAFHENSLNLDVPRIIPREIDSNSFNIKGVEIIPIPLYHGKLEIFGFRIRDFAYCTDVSLIPEESYRLLENLQYLILDALRFKPHPTHFSIDQAVEQAKKINANETFFTHLSHSILHEEVEASLPENIHLSYDGLRIIHE